MNTIIQKAKETHELSRDEIIALLKDDSIKLLMKLEKNILVMKCI